MPVYDYRCRRCGIRFEAVRSVLLRDLAECPDCKDIGVRMFVPTANLIVPAHFRIEASWMLPDKDDKAGWEARGGSGSQTHVRREKTFKQEFDEIYKGDL